MMDLERLLYSMMNSKALRLSPLEYLVTHAEALRKNMHFYRFEWED